ncbi:hypothetical protein ACFX1Q_000433 [Malus domestica]
MDEEPMPVRIVVQWRCDWGQTQRRREAESFGGFQSKGLIFFPDCVSEHRASGRSHSFRRRWTSINALSASSDCFPDRVRHHPRIRSDSLLI